MCDTDELAKMRIEFAALMKAQHQKRTEYYRESIDLGNRAATLRAQIMAAEGERRLRLVK